MKKWPTLWFTVWLEDEIRRRYEKLIQNEFRENFLVNVFHATKVLGKFDSKKSLSEILRFKGRIMLDSGGFLYQKEGKSPPSVDEYLEITKKLKPDVVVALDFPLDPLITQNNNERISKTLKNLIEIRDKFNSERVIIMPVLHGFNIKTVEYMLQFMEKHDVDLSYVGLGSLVPLIRHRVKHGRQIIIDLVAYLRKRLPHSLLHVFGIGGTTTMHIMFFMGVNSIDSAGWEKKAANGVIQLPGIGDRFLSKKPHNRTVLKPKELKVLEKCQCPVCLRYDNIKERIQVLNEKRDYRVVHNAWVYQKEVNMAREMIKTGKYESYINNVLQSKSFKSLFNYAKHMVKEYKINNVI
jgi:tRNA-guanine family transglycosylase